MESDDKGALKFNGTAEIVTEDMGTGKTINWTVRGRYTTWIRWVLKVGKSELWRQIVNDRCHPDGLQILMGNCMELPFMLITSGNPW
jgi:hypothetical protein